MMQSTHTAFTATWIALSFCTVSMALRGAGANADESPAALPEAMLRLTNGDSIPGQLVRSDDPAVVHWQSRLFTKPLQFAVDDVGAVLYASAATPPPLFGEYGFELAMGDVLFGSLRSLTDDEAELDVPQFGRIHVRRDHICRLYHRRGEDLIYTGPNGLAGWNQSSPTRWRDDGGRPFTDQPDVFLYGDFKIPARAAIEFEVSWNDKPDFVIALDVDERPATLQRAFRFEVWDSDLVVHRETENEADVVSVQEIQPGAGHAHLFTYLDRNVGQLLVFSPTGLKLADLNIAPRRAQQNTGLWLVNKRGDLRLERLRISHWNGVTPQEVQAGPSLRRTDGSLVRGQLTAFDPAANVFTVRDAQGETRVAADQITSVFLSPVTSATGPDPIFRAICQDGTQLSGELTNVDDGQLSLVCRGIREPLQLPITQLRSLTVLQHRNVPSAPASPMDRTGTLEVEGIRLRGQLIDGREEPDASCLVWKPERCNTGSPLRLGLAGRIVYREPVPPPTRVTRPQLEQQRIVIRDGVARVLASELRQPPVASKKATPALHLRSGDVIPCEVQKIDERGVTFRTPLSLATFVAHEQVKAVELSNIQSALKLNMVKRERLLTLPRMQRGSPPTHLICSSNGDFLRGRLIEMDDKNLRVELRLETQELARDRVSQIIWLHADELDTSQAPDDPPAIPSRPTATRVQAIRSDGNRLTFLAHELSGQMLLGKSEVLGQCQAELSQLDQLVFGSAIEKATTDLVYHQWKLHNAVDPKFVQSADGQTPAAEIPGTESALVGKPAPDFELSLVGGGKFHLAQKKGTVTVLDFWATWCGPCLQAMPQIERVIQEFEGQVEWIAVNLEEGEEQISSTLERHKLQVTAALDRNGAVAAKYAVTAIPQTVIIDRAGNVARLFVGGGPHLGDQIRDALQSLIDHQD